MAASGSFEKWLGVNYRVTIDWTEGTKNIAENTTNVTFVCNFISGASGANFVIAANTDSITANGKTFQPTHSATTIKGIVSKQLWSVTYALPHDSDGSFKNKAVSCTVNLNLYLQSGSYPSATASTTMTLESIARASTMTFSGTTLGSKVKFAVTAASTAFKHTLTYKYGSATGTIFSNKAAGNYEFTPPLTLAEQFKTAKSGSVTYTLTTKNGSTTVGSQTYTSKWNIPSSAAPTVSLGWASIAPYNAGTAAASISAFVQGYSKAEVAFDASKISLKYGASVKSYSISCNGVTDSASLYRTGTLSGTSATITCTITDSRGYTASEPLDIVLLPYSKPTLTDISLYRANAAGEPDSAGTHIYAKAKLTYSALNNMNACQLLGYYRAQAGIYGSAVSLTSGADNFITNTALTTQTYVAKIVATDSLGNSVSYEATIPTDSVAFHIKPGGKGAAFGKYCENDNLLEVDWDLKVNGAFHMAQPLGIESGGTGATTAEEARKNLGIVDDTGWVDLGLGGAVSESTESMGKSPYPCAYRVENGNHVYIAFNCKFAYEGSALRINGAAIPAAHRPAKQVYTFVPMGGKYIARVITTPAGLVWIEWVQNLLSTTATTSVTGNWIDGYVDYWL